MQTDVHVVPVDCDLTGHNLLTSATMALTLVL